MAGHANQNITPTQERWPPARPAAMASPAMVRLEQMARGDEACFMTEKRLRCQHAACELRARCRRLVAAWMR